MQHLGRADAVDDLQAEALLPAVEGVRRQRLGGRHAQAHRVQRAVGAVLAHQRAVERRDRAEHRRAMLAQLGEDRLGTRQARHEHRRRAEPQREREAVAQPVGVEELGRREDDVVLAQAEHLAREGLARHLDVVMQVHDALGLARRARAVEPEGHVVAVRRRRVELVALRRQPRRRARPRRCRRRRGRGSGRRARRAPRACAGAGRRRWPRCPRRSPRRSGGSCRGGRAG